MNFFELTLDKLVAYLLIAIIIYGIYSFFRYRKLSHDVNWTLYEAIGVTLGIYFLTQIVAALLITYVAQLTGNEHHLDSAPVQFLTILLVSLSSIGLIYVFIKKFRRTPLNLIGVVRPKLQDIWLALAGFAIYLVTYLTTIVILKQFIPSLNTEQKQELGFSTSVAGPELIFIFVSLVILPPLAEEFMVRGFLYTGIRTKIKPVLAAILTSVIFAVAHLQWGSGKALLWVAAIDTFVLSLVLVYLRQKTGSLWPGVVVHFIKNSLAFIALFVLKIT